MINALFATLIVFVLRIATWGMDQLFQTKGGSVCLPDVFESLGGNSDTASWIKYDSEHKRTHVHTHTYAHARLCFRLHTFRMCTLIWAHTCTQVMHTRQATRHTQCSSHSLVFSTSQLLTDPFKQTLKCSQWCVTCSGLPQSPLCVCVYGSGITLIVM